MLTDEDILKAQLTYLRSLIKQALKKNTIEEIKEKLNKGLNYGSR